MEEWSENNNRYLEASLEWLRLRLDQLASEHRPAQASSESMPDAAGPTSVKRKRFAPWLRQNEESQPAIRLLTEGTAWREEAVKEAAAKRQAAAQVDPPPALLILASRFGLSDFERDTLLLCAALEFDPLSGVTCGAAQGHGGKNYPTFALALALFEDGSWDALAAHRPLRYSRLIEINQPGSTPLTASALRADERVVNFLKGL